MVYNIALSSENATQGKIHILSISCSNVDNQNNKKILKVARGNKKHKQTRKKYFKMSEIMQTRYLRGIFLNAERKQLNFPTQKPLLSNQKSILR